MRQKQNQRIVEWHFLNMLLTNIPTCDIIPSYKILGKEENTMTNRKNNCSAININVLTSEDTKA